jgi:hypothetical protein
MSPMRLNILSSFRMAEYPARQQVVLETQEAKQQATETDCSGCAVHVFVLDSSAKIPAMADANYFIHAVDIVGAVASVVGLGFTIYVLSVAKDAKAAAEQAREAALSSARKRSLIEDLEDIRRMIQQVGNLIQQEEWMAVHMRTEEIVGTCKVAMARWGDGLSIEAGDGVVTAGNLLQSIAAKSSEYGERPLTPPEKNKLISTHLRASALVHTALGEARRLEEREDRDANSLVSGETFAIKAQAT